jgi:hypothetical protein
MNKGSGNNKKILYRINKFALSTLTDVLSYVIGKNALFHVQEILTVVLYASIRNLSVEGASEELLSLSEGEVCSPDVVQRRVQQKSEKEVVEDFKHAQQKIYHVLRKMRLLFSKVTVAIDCTDKLYYGDKNDRGVVGTKHQRGTSYCFRYMTVHIVIGDAKITLLSLPVKPLSDKAKLVDVLLTYAEENAKIGLVLLDRGFFSKAVLKVLEKHQVKFLLPVPKNKLVKKMIKEAHTNKHFVTTYWFKQKKTVVGMFTMFFVLDPNCKEKQIWKRYQVFGTNLPVTNQTREVFAEIYRKRWGIETSYRIEKHEFLAETTSKSCAFRLFLFLVAMILYNFWIILRCILGEKFYVRRWKTSLYILIHSSGVFHRVSNDTLGESGEKTADFGTVISVRSVKMWCFSPENQHIFITNLMVFNVISTKTNPQPMIKCLERGSCGSTEYSK